MANLGASGYLRPADGVMGGIIPALMFWRWGAVYLYWNAEESVVTGSSCGWWVEKSD